MQNSNSAPANKEAAVQAVNGWLMLAVNLALLVAGWYLILQPLVAAAADDAPVALTRLFTGIGLQTLAVILLCGHFTLQPNVARVLILFCCTAFVEERHSTGGVLAVPPHTRDYS